jgi:hypothetical protein
VLCDPNFWTGLPSGGTGQDSRGVGGRRRLKEAEAAVLGSRK